MKNILETIIEYKKQVIADAKQNATIEQLEKSIWFDYSVISMSHYLQKEDEVGIIAEIKRGSPSAGIFQKNIDVEEISQNYLEAGATALSVLTDKKFFHGTLEDLAIVTANNNRPVLRKDFIIDEYQIIESRSYGADCILLIAACLSPKDCRSLAQFAKDLGLEILLEVREQQEIDSHYNEFIDVIGVNNRDLKTFKTDILKSQELFEFLPKDVVKISESGLQNAEQLKYLKDVGYNGFLIGGHFMQFDNPGLACKQLVEDFKAL